MTSELVTPLLLFNMWQSSRGRYIRTMVWQNWTQLSDVEKNIWIEMKENVNQWITDHPVEEPDEKFFLEEPAQSAMETTVACARTTINIPIELARAYDYLMSATKAGVATDEMHMLFYMLKAIWQKL